MNIARLPHYFFIFGAALLFAAAGNAQDLTPWTNTVTPYGNEWIDYSRKYVRLGVVADGIHRVSISDLAAKVPELDASNVQAYHRGKRVALLIEGGDIFFYARKNDGASDGLLFRPGPDARLNTYDSFFSEEGSYFFTTLTGASNDVFYGIGTVDGQPQGSVTEETYYMEKVVVTNSGWDANDMRLSKQFTFTDNLEETTLNQSFFESVNAFIIPLRTGPQQSTETDWQWKNTLSLTGYDDDAPVSPTLEFSLHGNGPNGRVVEVYAAPDDAGLPTNQVYVSPTIFGFSGIKASVDLSGSNISSAGAMILQFRSPTVRNSGNAYGVSYYAITYPRSLSFSGQTNKRFYFNAGVSGKRRIAITGVASGVKVFDITNEYQPKLINGAFADGTITLDVDRVAESPLVLQVVSSAGAVAVTTARQHDVKFNLLYSSYTKTEVANIKPDPSAFDYLIITHDAEEKNPDNSDLRYVKVGAKEYGDYRGKPEGGGYKTLVITTRAVYDQFNFGEASPIAIGRFVNYMISENVRPTHNVLLIGHGMGKPRFIKRERPDDVPTYGNPGSDVLLVSGLSNAVNPSPDVPAVPIGRITAFTNDDVRNYLNKVKLYELQSKTFSATDLSWRRRILHMIGYKTSGETTRFSNYVQTAKTNIQNLDPLYPWINIDAANVPPPSGEATRTSAVSAIKSDVDAGVGVIAYYGHGNYTGMIYNMDTPEKYVNSPRFPFIYITGCGVGDAYFSQSVKHVATKWITAPDSGAIAMFANTFLAYEDYAADYLKGLYGQIFGVNDANRATIGQILVSMARNTYNATSGNPANMSNIHQTALFGDPAVRIAGLTYSTLPVSYIHFKGTPIENRHVQLDWQTGFEKDSDRFSVLRSSDGKKFEAIGEVKAMGTTSEGHRYYFTDYAPLPGKNYYRLQQFDRTEDSSEPVSSYSDIVVVDMSYKGLTRVYPNPATDEVTISAAENRTVKSWQLTDHSGRVLLHGAGSSVRMKGLAPGVFILEITQDNGEIVRKQLVKY